jgi:hypothetical protein
MMSVGFAAVRRIFLMVDIVIVVVLAGEASRGTGSAVSWALDSHIARTV